ncbi:MAG: translational GTPase TypA [Anaerolineaceae bacterium]|nr:translational GTPase TypA [Anaerolineaceae bacterium]
MKRTDLRNIAIIAHVDHGKTTLVDGMLRQAHIFRENQHVVERVMDSNDLERERGITILSKNTAIEIMDPTTKEIVKINIVDTPGHADFGGEVERVMGMVDGVLLLVDAAEGVKPQTRFVLKKALQIGHRVIVVINKMDRRDADPDRALNQTFDLFIELGATEEQADFPVIYANGILGRAGETRDLSDNLQPLFTSILREIPAPDVELDKPLQMLIANLGYDEYRGTTAVGRITAGELHEKQRVARMKLDGTIVPDQVIYLYKYQGLEKIETQSAKAGDIISLAGLSNVEIGETLADIDHPVALPPITVEEPTVRMTFSVNTSPFTGQEGKWGTSRKLRERLFNELRNNVALRVEETDSAESFSVSGRGELHLAILIETMRREGYEFQVSRPEAIFIQGENGETLEPYEEVHVDTSEETVGIVVEMLGSRRGIMLNMLNNPDGTTHVTYRVPTRGLLGFRYQFLTATRGMGVMNTIFDGYDKIAQNIIGRSSGSIVARETADTTTFGLKNAEERGILFVGAGVRVYEGMVVGEYQRAGDISINVCKKKHLTNMRQSNKDIEVRLSTPRTMSLDESIEYLADDELLEVTPQNIRIRKKILNTDDRGKTEKKSKELLGV